MNDVLGDPHATGRLTAQRLAGLGSKGSWKDLYRLPEAEYIEGGSVADLLLSEENDLDGIQTVKPKSDTDSSPADHAGAKVVLEKTSKKSKVSKNKTKGGKVDNGPEAFIERAANFGIIVEGLDD